VTTLASRKEGLRSPEDVVRGADGSLYWTDDDTGGLWRLAADGSVSQPLTAQNGLPSTEGLAASPSGAILMGDGEKSRVVRLDPDGTATPLPVAIDKPESMAFDQAGNLYIADNRAGVLYMIGRDGRLHRTIAGREGFSPESIRYAGGSLYITDSTDGKLFRYTPEDGLKALAVFAGDYVKVQGVTTDPAGNIYLSVQTDLKGGRGMILRLRRSGAR
jgi:streptogramin lyase